MNTPKSLYFSMKKDHKSFQKTMQALSSFFTTFFAAGARSNWTPRLTEVRTLEKGRRVCGNDGVLFTIPGASGLCNTSRDFASPESVPDFIQALEHPSLDNPGTVAHLTLRLGGGVDAPDRVTLGGWINQLQWQAFEKPHVDWEFPVQPMGNDSGVILYWNEKTIRAGGHRNLRFAYGLGNIASSEGGQRGLTVGGSFRPGEEFTVTAYIHEPLPRQTVSLELPRGLKRVEGEATQNVPSLLVGAASRNSPVTWKVKAARARRFTLRLKSSNGLSKSQVVTVSSKAFSIELISSA